MTLVMNTCKGHLLAELKVDIFYDGGNDAKAVVLHFDCVLRVDLLQPLLLDAVDSYNGRNHIVC